MKLNTRFSWCLFFSAGVWALASQLVFCVNGGVNALELDSLGRLVLVGSDRSSSGQEVALSARLTTSGILDTTFNPLASGVFRNEAHAFSRFRDVEVLPNDEILAFGSAEPGSFFRTLQVRSISGSFTAVIDTVLSSGNALAHVSGITGLAIGGQSRFSGGLGAFIGLVDPTDLSTITQEFFKPLGLEGASVGAVVNDHTDVSKLYVAGGTFNDLSKRGFIAKFERIGNSLQLDAAFGSGGFVFSSPAEQVGYGALCQDAAGNVVVLGTANAQAIVEKWDSTGTLVGAFGVGGRLTISPNLKFTAGAIVCQSDDKPVIAGTNRIKGVQQLTVLRAAADGSGLDATFGINGMYALDFDAASFANDLVLDAAGNMFVGGGIGLKTLVAKINPSGALDSSFGFQGAFSDFFDAVTPSTVILQQEATSGTDGGALSAAVTTRVLNAIKPVGGTSRVQLGGGGSFVLQPGTYIIRAHAFASAVGGHQVELFNVTNAALEAVGSSHDSTAGPTVSELVHTVTILSPTTYELRHRVAVPSVLPTAQGLAASLGNTEVHARVVVRAE